MWLCGQPRREKDTMAIKDNEAIYDAQIAPLMTQIIAGMPGTQHPDGGVIPTQRW